MTTNYSLYKRRNPSTPFLIVDQDTVDSTSTPEYYVGKTWVGYGQIMQQNTLWQMENFANNTAPSPALLGMQYFSTVDNMMYMCTQESPTIWTKTAAPIVSSTAPTLQLTVGNLWYNTVDGNLYSYSGSSWTQVGQSNATLAGVSASYYYNVVTPGATPSEMWLDGIANNRQIIAPDTTWLFQINLTARAELLTSESIVMTIKGTLDRPDSGSVTIPGGLSTEIYNQSATLAGASVSVSANVANNSLLIQVTGIVGTTINWNAVLGVTICNT